jgi:hypothetical protein
MSESIKGAGSVLQADEMKVAGFFEKNPKAAAIGTAIAAAIVLFVLIAIF